MIVHGWFEEHHVVTCVTIYCVMFFSHTEASEHKSKHNSKGPGCKRNNNNDCIIVFFYVVMVLLTIFSITNHPNNLVNNIRFNKHAIKQFILVKLLVNIQPDTKLKTLICEL